MLNSSLARTLPKRKEKLHGIYRRPIDQFSPRNVAALHLAVYNGLSISFISFYIKRAVTSRKTTYNSVLDLAHHTRLLLGPDLTGPKVNRSFRLVQEPSHSATYSEHTVS